MDQAAAALQRLEVAVVTCPSCNRENADGLRFCAKCGTRFVDAATSIDPLVEEPRSALLGEVASQLTTPIYRSKLLIVVLGLVVLVALLPTNGSVANGALFVLSLIGLAAFVSIAIPIKRLGFRSRTFAAVLVLLTCVSWVVWAGREDAREKRLQKEDPAAYQAEIDEKAARRAKLQEDRERREQAKREQAAPEQPKAPTPAANATGTVEQPDAAGSPGAQVPVAESREIPAVLAEARRNAKAAGFTNPVYLAVQNGSIEEVRRLIAFGADVNEREPEILFHFGQTPLQRAAWSGRSDMIETLLVAGADISAKDDNGMTALHWAVGGSADGVRALLSHGASRYLETRGDTIQGDKGLTPLLWASMFGKPDVAAALIEAGADVSASAPDRSSTPLHLAVEGMNLLRGKRQERSEDRLAVVQHLLAAGADPNARNSQGRTPLAAMPAELNAVGIAIVQTLRQHGGTD